MAKINFAEKFRTVRESEGLSQSDIAKKLQVTRAAVNAWETGRSLPCADAFVALAKLMHVSSDYLLGLENKDDPVLGGLDSNDYFILFTLINRLREKNAELGIDAAF